MVNRATAPDAFTSDLPVCYELRLYLSNRLMQLPVGTPFAFTTSDPDAPEAIAEWCDLRGYTLISVEQTADGRWQFALCR